MCCPVHNSHWINAHIFKSGRQFPTSKWQKNNFGKIFNLVKFYDLLLNTCKYNTLMWLFISFGSLLKRSRSPVAMVTTINEVGSIVLVWKCRDNKFSGECTSDQWVSWYSYPEYRYATRGAVSFIAWNIYCRTPKVESVFLFA